MTLGRPPINRRIWPGNFSQGKKQKSVPRALRLGGPPRPRKFNVKKRKFDIFAGQQLQGQMGQFYRVCGFALLFSFSV
jgi:hypothetical protein